MPASLLVAMLGLGLVSGVHCIGMCGGIVLAFSSRPLLERRALWRRQVAFNAGRITSYAIAGAAAGASAYVLRGLPVQTALYVAANALLILVGLQLAGWRSPLRWVEALGLPLWRHLQPLAARLTAAPGAGGAFAAGLVWGWLPCGLVYGALAAAATFGSPLAGAAAMLAFGLGTLPWLLAAGVGAAKLRRFLSHPPARIAAGTLVAAFGVLGLARAASLSEAIQNVFVCL